MTAPHILLVGAGNMGGAMLRGWLGSGMSAKAVTVADPAADEGMVEFLREKRVRLIADPSEAKQPDIVILAVKPQIIERVLPGLSGIVDGDTLLVSVAAGTTMDTLRAPFSPSPRVVRVMPNTPALVQRGMSVCCASEDVDEAARDTITRLMEAVGSVAWIEDEAQMDAVTGVSGSGPAYVFYLTEALAEAGMAAGLPESLSRQLALQTVAGAGDLMRQSDDTPANLRKNVTSPNGTTQAALDVLMAQDGLAPLMRRAVAAAAARSKELSEGK